MEYAENLHYNQSVQYEDYDEAPFEDAICNFIAENGYEVDKKVGCAGFRVDLAIKDPDNPGKYILGIQCDGHNYASSKVARDRDRLREQVLKGLGWNIYHIWSTDWYRNRDLARAKLLENIESTIIDTKVNDLRKKINDVESMKINPVTTVILGKNDDEDNDDFIENNEEYDMNIPEDIDDGRVMGGYISMIFQCRNMTWDFTAFSEEKTVLEVNKAQLENHGRHPEMTEAYTSYFNGMVKTLVNTEWVVRNERDDDVVRFIIEKAPYGIRRHKPGFDY